MRTLAAGSKHLLHQARGFTLLELLVVVALIAVATAGVSLSLRDSADSALERDAERLTTLLEAARAQARANGSPVVWRTQTEGDSHHFVFEGLPPPGLPQHWLAASTRVEPRTALSLGPEPLIEPSAVALYSHTRPARRLWVVTDGLRPFKVQNTPQQVPP
jgi:general secretion pathway protein H